jgi:hypothetical protein
MHEKQIQGHLVDGNEEAKLYLLTRREPIEQPSPRMIDLSELMSGHIRFQSAMLYPLGMTLALDVAISRIGYTLVGVVSGFDRVEGGFTIELRVQAIPKDLVDELGLGTT